jgi:glycerol kinase
MDTYYLALDQGGHSSRALLFNAQGELAASQAVAVVTTHPAPDRVEQDPEELVRSLMDAVTNVMAQLPASGRVLAAGLATQRSSLACWQRSTGRPLSPVLSWQDRRNAGWLTNLAPRAAEIRALTGLVLSPHYGASKLRWCLEHLPAVAEALARGDLCMGPLASFLSFRLVKERPFLADPANAARTQLWSPATGDWAPALLDLFGVPAEVLPRPVTSRYAYGHLDTTAGLVPLTVVTGDQSAVPFAFGPLDPGTAYVNVGTGAFVQRACRDRLPDAPRLLVSVVWSEPGRVDYLLEGTVNGAGAALDWLAQQEGRTVPALLAAAEAAFVHKVEPPLFINGVGGVGSPYWASDLPSVFLASQGAGNDPGARALAVLESIVFLLLENLGAMDDGQEPLRRILLTGGLSAHPAVPQSLADLARLPVLRADDPEATARGLARLVAGAAGEQWPKARGALLQPAPNPELAERYRRWRREMEARVPPMHLQQVPR